MVWLHGKFHRFLLPFSSKFSDLNFASYVLYNLPVLCHVSRTVSLGYLGCHEGNIAKKNYVKRETVHCYPRNVDRCCTWSEVAWCCRWNLSAFFKICFSFVLLYNKTLNDWLAWERLRFSGNKIQCSPRDQSLSVKCAPLRQCINTYMYGPYKGIPPGSAKTTV